MRKDPFTRQLRFHKGMDLAAPEGSEVRAAMEGEVVFAGFKSGYGNTIIVQQAGGLETTYAHLASIDVKEGAAISADQILGSVGNTGHSTGPHLHFEVSRWGELIDPRNALTD
jgi:murein DD-endopeptidase MepM/ murein hydrolase activator NlpD